MLILQISVTVPQNRDLKDQTGSLPFEMVTQTLKLTDLRWHWIILWQDSKVHLLMPDASISPTYSIYQFDKELQPFVY